jgi:hypothetical protein
VQLPPVPRIMSYGDRQQTPVALGFIAGIATVGSNFDSDPTLEDRLLGSTDLLFPPLRVAGRWPGPCRLADGAFGSHRGWLQMAAR